jgi:hypothetical protein
MGFACMYEWFGLVSFSQATDKQIEAVASWVRSGDLPASRDGTRGVCL